MPKIKVAKPRITSADLTQLVQIILRKDHILAELSKLNFNIEDRTEVDGCIRIFGDETIRSVLTNYDLDGVPFLSVKTSDGIHKHWELPLKQIRFFNKF